MLNSFQTLQPNSVAPSLHSECDKPSGLGFNFMEEEIWKPIPNFDGIYECSNIGRIRRMVRITGSKGKVYKKVLTTPSIIKQANVGKYLFVGLYKNNIRSQMYVHRIILATFSPKEGMGNLYVNHKDFNTKNNIVSNLEWVTPLENTRYSIERGRFDEMPKFRRNRELKKVLDGVHPFMRPEVQQKMNVARLKRWSNMGRQTLSDKSISDILLSDLSAWALSKKYKVSYGVITRILKEKNGISKD